MDVRSWYFLDDLPQLPLGCVATVGTFDGIHRGHQLLIEETKERARAYKVPSVLVSIYPHPRRVLQPDQAPPLLAPLPFRASLALHHGIDYVCVLRFDSARAQQEPEDFVRQVCVETLQVHHVVVGENFRFGRRARGTTTLLREEGSRYGFSVTSVPLLGDSHDSAPSQNGNDTSGELAFSSTRVRQCLSQGNVAQAREILGRNHVLSGQVIVGAQRGRELGYPTANIMWQDDCAVPADGVYAGWIRFRDATDPVLHDGLVPDARALAYAADGSSVPMTSDAVIVPGVRYRCAISVGTNPTFAGQSRSVEAFVMGATGNMYAREVIVEFVSLIRGQVNFSSIPDLLDQMAHDVAEIDQVLAAEKDAQDALAFLTTVPGVN